jgi:opine dehydrogenase
MKIAVLGAGHGGHAMTADLSMAGHEVNLYELPEFEDNIRPIREKGGIYITARRPPAEEFQLPGGGRTGFAKITGKVTTNIEDAVKDVNLIMLVVPAFARKRFIKELAPYLRDGQTLVIWPAYYGALLAAEMLRREGVKKDITIAETESLIYACKKSGPAQVLVKDFKRSLAIASLPAKRIPKVMELLSKIYPQLTPATNVLETSFSNLNPVLHPPSVLLNLYRVEAKFYPYSPEVGGPLCRCYDVTPAMANVMEAVDKERMTIGNKLGLNLKNLKTVLSIYYGATGKDLYETILNAPPYQKQLAPTSLDHRYVTEDVPYGLVPLAQLGKQLGVETPTIEALITIASAESGKNFWREGLTLEEIGLAGKTTEEIITYVERGKERE